MHAIRITQCNQKSQEITIVFLLRFIFVDHLSFFKIETWSPKLRKLSPIFLSRRIIGIFKIHKLIFHFAQTNIRNRQLKKLKKIQIVSLNE